MIKKEFILKLLSIIDKQWKKDEEFCKAVEGYFTDSTLISNQNNDIMSAIDYMWEVLVEKHDPEKKSESFQTWLDWYLFEVKMFGNESSAYIGEKEYKIKSDEDFADFILDWIEYDKGLNDRE